MLVYQQIRSRVPELESTLGTQIPTTGNSKFGEAWIASPHPLLRTSVACFLVGSPTSLTYVDQVCQSTQPVLGLSLHFISLVRACGQEKQHSPWHVESVSKCCQIEM